MIEFENVHLKYGSREILGGVSLGIDDGLVTAILGPSGSGKSTILKLMLGLIRPSSGSVVIDGIDIAALKERDLFAIRRKMGMVFQGNALFDSLDVAENMGFFLKENLRLPADEIARRVDEQLAFAGLLGYEHQLPDTLSGGMRKRLAIGRALIFEPRMILLDEPTAGLDPVSSRRIIDEIRDLRESRGLGAVMVTHIIGDVMQCADRVLVLYQGRIIFDDIPDALAESTHPFIESFMRDPEIA